MGGGSWRSTDQTVPLLGSMRRRVILSAVMLSTSQEGAYTIEQRGFPGRSSRGSKRYGSNGLLLHRLPHRRPPIAPSLLLSAGGSPPRSLMMSGLRPSLPRFLGS